MAGCSWEALNKFEFDVGVESPDFKFSCAHFVAQHGGRCRVHGHNYALSLTLGGPVGPDGYVIDFGDLKKAVRRFCQEMNEHFLVPAKSELLTIEESGISVRMRTQASEEVVIPRTDCKFLPIARTTTEEIAGYALENIRDMMGSEYLRQRETKWIEVSVSEQAGSRVTCRRSF